MRNPKSERNTEEKKHYTEELKTVGDKARELLFVHCLVVLLALLVLLALRDEVHDIDLHFTGCLSE